jgi:hypothetical protein
MASPFVWVVRAVVEHRIDAIVVAREPPCKPMTRQLDHVG